MSSVFFCVSLASSGSLVLRHLLTYSIILRLSSLFPSSSKILSCCLISFLTNLLIWAIIELYKPTILSGLGLLNFLVLTIIIRKLFLTLNNEIKETSVSQYEREELLLCSSNHNLHGAYFATHGHTTTMSFDTHLFGR